MQEKKSGKSKQIAAIIGIVLLVGMYIMTLVFALCRFPGADRLFMASLFSTILIPILIWVYIWIYGMVTRKKTVATVFPDAPTEEEILEAKLHQCESTSESDDDKKEV